MSDTQPFLHEQIAANAADEAQRQAHRESVLAGLQQQHAQAAVQPGMRDQVIDARVAAAGLPEAHVKPGEVSDVIAQAGLSDAVRHRQPGGDPDGN